MTDEQEVVTRYPGPAAGTGYGGEQRPRLLSEDDALRQYLPMIEGLARKFDVGSDLIDADDLISEGMIAAVVCFREFDVSKGTSLTRFVRSRVRQRMINLIQKSNVRRRNEEEAQEDEETDGARAPIIPRGEGWEDKIITRVAMERNTDLQPMERIVLVDRFWNDRTMRQIDNARDFEPGTARKLYASALLKLKEIGIDSFEGED